MKIVKESLISEFHKSGDVKGDLNIGIDAIKKNMLKYIKDPEYLGPKTMSPHVYQHDKLTDLIKKNKNISEEEALEQLVSEIMEERSNFEDLIFMETREYPLLNYLYESNLIFRPSAVNKSPIYISLVFTFASDMDTVFKHKFPTIKEETINWIKSLDPKDIKKAAMKASRFPKELMEIAIEVGGKSIIEPNKIFSFGLSQEDSSLIKMGVKAGATNTNSSYSAAVYYACVERDLELLELLLDDPNIDPSETIAQRRVSKTNPKADILNHLQSPLRSAIKNPYLIAFFNNTERVKYDSMSFDLVNTLLKHPKVDPTISGNGPLKDAINLNLTKTINLLLSDKRVRNTLNSGLINKLEDLGIEI